jgi:hypothetical protein
MRERHQILDALENVGDNAIRRSDVVRRDIFPDFFKIVSCVRMKCGTRS